MPTYDETDIANLLRLLPPAPERWVAEAKALPRTRAELDRVLSTIGEAEDEDGFGGSFDHDDRLVGSASGGRGYDDVEGHMHENEKRPSGLDEEVDEDVEGHVHESEKRPSGKRPSGKRPSGLDEDFDEDVEGHVHESEKRPSGKRPSGKRPSGLDEDFDEDVEGHMHESEKRPSGKRPSGLDEESDEDF